MAVASQSNKLQGYEFRQVPILSAIRVCGSDRYEFKKRIKRYKGDFNCWNQFVQLFFGQLTSLNSLCDICLWLKAHKQKLYHLGIKQYVNQSAISRANENRDWWIFADFRDYLIKLVRPLYMESPIPNVDINNEIFALDSTTISCSINLMTWAEGKYSKRAVKVHTLIDLRGSIPDFILITDERYHDSNALDEIIPIADAIYLIDKAYVDFEALYRMHKCGAYFVTRAKKVLKYDVVEQNYNIDQTTGLRTDKTIMLTVAKSKKLYPEELILVEFCDQEKDNELVFLTNNFEVSAMEVTYLYKNRWQVETFHKWIKQNLAIKQFWGYPPNAVKIHILTAICTYLIVAYVMHLLKTTLSIYEIMQILSISAFDKTPLRELLTDIQYNSNQNVKDQLELFSSNF